MLTAVLAEIDGWFDANVFAPLARAEAPAQAVTAMFDAVDAYFRSGRRVCLLGVLALGDARDRFAQPVRSYFLRWIEALADALTGAGHERGSALAIAEEVVAGIQGGIVLARALDDPDTFGRTVAKLRATATAIPKAPDTASLASSG